MKFEVDQQLIPEKERLSETLLNSIGEKISSEVETIPKDAVVALVFVTDEQIQGLNKQYRNKDSVTDVLSFSYIQGDDHDIVGDIAISYDQAERQQNYGIHAELVMLIVHGTLHVFGFDHEEETEAKEMFKIQDKLVAELL